MRKVTILIFILCISVALTGCVKEKGVDKEQDKITQQRIQEKIDNLQVETLGDLTEQEVDILSEPSKQKVLKNKQDDCDTMSGEKKEECLEMVKSLQVTFIDRVELCNQLNKQKGHCLNNLAIKREDPQICGLIEDEHLKEFCKDSIIHNQALKAGDISLCDTMSDNMQKEMCIESIIEFQHDIEFCNSRYIMKNNIIDKCKSISSQPNKPLSKYSK